LITRSGKLGGDGIEVSKRRLVLLLTVLAVVALAGVFAVVGWDQADRIAIVVAGLVAVAALGVEVRAALLGEPTAGVQVKDTGSARASKGAIATSGLSGTAPSAGLVEVEHTGSADASESGEATSGIRLDGPRQD
jgi:hypothetical protein